MGTAPDCPVCLAGEAGVATYHAELNLAGHQLQVMDLDSRGGTFVNGQPVRRAVLLPGDVLQVGNVQLRLDRG